MKTNYDGHEWNSYSILMQQLNQSLFLSLGFSLLGAKFRKSSLPTYCAKVVQKRVLFQQNFGLRKKPIINMNGANILDEQVCGCHWHHQHLYGFQYQQYQKKSNQLKAEAKW